MRKIFDYDITMDFGYNIAKNCYFIKYNINNYFRNYLTCELTLCEMIEKHHPIKPAWTWQFDSVLRRSIIIEFEQYKNKLWC